MKTYTQDQWEDLTSTEQAIKEAEFLMAEKQYEERKKELELLEEKELQFIY